MYIILFFIIAYLVIMISGYESPKTKNDRINNIHEGTVKSYLESYAKAKFFFDRKEYKDAKLHFYNALKEQQWIKKPDYCIKSADEILYPAHLCEFYLKEYASALKGLENYDNEEALICKVVSAFNLGYYTLSENIFKKGQGKNYFDLDKLYDTYFDSSKNRKIIWDTFSSDLKHLLAENIKIDLDKQNSNQLTENEIIQIFSLKSLNIAKRKEEYRYSLEGWWIETDYYEGWMNFSETSKYTITSLSFCYFFKNIEELNISNQPISSFSGLEKHTNLKHLNASFIDKLDSSLLNLFVNLQTLNLHCSSTTIKDLPIAPISKMDLTMCRITDFQQINRLKTLKELSLYKTNLQSLTQIKDLANLEYLLIGTGMNSDNINLDTNCNLHKLKELYYYLAKEEEIIQFNSKFPSCKIQKHDSNGNIFHRKPNYNPSDYLDFY